MFNMDREQIKVFLIMSAVIVALTGYIVYREAAGADFPIELAQMEGMPEERGTNGYKENNEQGHEHDDQDKKEETKTIKVYITGQVVKPGVKEVTEGSRLEDVVKIAGGFLEDADLKRVNLAIRVEDEGMYIVPKVGEEVPDQVMTGPKPQKPGRVNINTADQNMLETLPRVGPVLAGAIIDYREYNGPFKQIEDIKNVPRIGDKTFEGIKDLITVE